MRWMENKVWTNLNYLFLKLFKINKPRIAPFAEIIKIIEGHSLSQRLIFFFWNFKD